MKNWRRRWVLALILFIVGGVFAILTVIDLNTNPNNIGPGSGLGILSPIAGAIMGYVIGGIIDIFSAAFKNRNRD